MRKASALLLFSLGIAVVCSAQTKNKIQVGVATYNEDEPYLKAFHAELEIGTRIRVTNQINNKAVIVTISGRIPQDPDRIVDIAKGAGDNIELSPTDPTPVMVEVLGGRRRASAPAEPPAVENLGASSTLWLGWIGAPAYRLSGGPR
jgi:rare lipoprotein A (peptidoglycan hydrolase)